jgi:hypothetical protein
VEGADNAGGEEMGWVEKLKAGVEQAAGEVEGMASIGKLRLEIRTLQGKLQGTLQAIGARAYDLYESGTILPAEVVALCHDADKVAAEIKTKEAEIGKIKAEV